MRPSRQMVFEGARSHARSLGFGMEMISLGKSGMSAEQLKRVLKARGVVGAIIEPLNRLDDPVPFPWNDFPVAAIGRSLEKPALHYSMSHY